MSKDIIDSLERMYNFILSNIMIRIAYSILREKTGSFFLQK